MTQLDPDPLHAYTDDNPSGFWTTSSSGGPDSDAVDAARPVLEEAALRGWTTVEVGGYTWRWQPARYAGWRSMDPEPAGSFLRRVVRRVLRGVGRG